MNRMQRLLITAGAAALLAAPAVAEQFILMTGVNHLNYPGAERIVLPDPGPGFPGTFYDGDRLAGTNEDGPPIVFQGIGEPFFKPNEFGSLSFIYRRASIPLDGGRQVPYQGIEFYAGPRLDLDGDLNNGSRSLIPVEGHDPVIIPGIPSYVDLSFDIGAGRIELNYLDVTGTNEGAPRVSARIATVLAVLAGTGTGGEPGDPINPSIDTRVGRLENFEGDNGRLRGVYRVSDLGFEFWQDSIDPGSSTADTLGTFQQLGFLRGWVVHRNRDTGAFPRLAGEGLGSSLWPKVDESQIGNTFKTANDLEGGQATIANGLGGDHFNKPNNGGVALNDFGGDLGGYLDSVVVPRVPGSSYRFVYLEAAGFGINNSRDPVYGDTISYDVVIVAYGFCPGDANGDGHVDLADLATLLAAFGTVEGDENYNANVDFDFNGRIDLADLAELLARFGQECT
jgi:hypothetical protein